MSYQVLARKWRPRRFEDVVGQPHVLRALTNALKTERLHHAYLFTGTRGVGKTTIARIFAKALNCESGVSSEPCGQCSACVSIDEGRFIDLIEVDAASRTKVEDTRDLLENVQYAPTSGRYKVYLIDEVHMLSGHSFNALLKTLEEPPLHVKFLLATTDPQRLPVTVLSRCLQFHLKAMPAGRIATYLAEQLTMEGITFDKPALDLVAEAAEGSMRDALSVLDQAIAYGDGVVSTHDVQSMLGTLSQDYLYGLIEAISEQNAPKLLTLCESIAELGLDFPHVLGELISRLHRIAVIQAVPQAYPRTEQNERLFVLSEHISKTDVQLFYQLALIARRDLPLAPNAKEGFEMAMLRLLAFAPATTAGAVAQPVKPEPPARNPAPVTPSKPVTEPAATPVIPAASPVPTREIAPAAIHAAPPVTISQPQTPPSAGPLDWNALLPQLQLKGALLSLASQCAFKSFDGKTLVLELEPKQAALLNERVKERLSEALSQYLACAIVLTIEIVKPSQETPALLQQRVSQEKHQEALEKLAQDPNLEAVHTLFGTKLDPEGVKVIE